ncbi:GxxExxY protein [Thiohalorhabdus sp.]|uniref:GxxExxY protein n=1 Tax=Thiohalorhabdus sp. TaxID=3094134 RepID=UPI003FCD872D
MGIELTMQEVPFQAQVPVEVWYRGEKLACTYRADMVCYQDLLVELKALGRVGSREKAQLLNYLRATGYERGLLLNFGGPKLQYECCVWTSS